MTWTYPTASPHVTSPFNPKRKHPVSGVVKPHTGTDFRAYEGTPLFAAAAGRVVRSTFDATTAGNYVRIDVGDGVWIGYSHLSTRRVAVGDRVDAGDLVGLAGSTGSATGAHLHFEVSVAGVKVDPVPFLAARVGAVAASQGGSALPTPPTPTALGRAPRPPAELDPEPDTNSTSEEDDDMRQVFITTTGTNTWALVTVDNRGRRTKRLMSPGEPELLVGLGLVDRAVLEQGVKYVPNGFFDSIPLTDDNPRGE